MLTTYPARTFGVASLFSSLPASFIYPMRGPGITAMETHLRAQLPL